MAARVRVERALADQAVNARFGAQISVRVVATYFYRRAFDASDFAFRFFEDFGFEPFLLAVAQVHAQQHRRPVLRFGTARARLDLDEAVVRIHRVVEHPAQLQLGDRVVEALGVVTDRSQGGFVLLFARQFQEFEEALGLVRSGFERFDQRFQLSFLLAKRLCFFGVVPDFRILQRQVGLFELPLQVGVVKDTSGVRRYAPGSSAVVLRSR